ncbi:MAG: VOC family protein, partial [bacterium]|nr:VOC family protein [bacterium]
MIFNAMIPELTVFDIKKTKEFYIDFLGFQLEYEREEDKFAFLSFGETQFMFEQLHENGWNVGELKYPLGQGINFSITTEEIEIYYIQLKAKNLKFYRELTVNTYQINDEVIEQKEFLIQDPNGYLLRFTNS